MRALLSVSDKTGLAELARGLASHGCELISTGGTARFLRQTDLPVVDVEAVTGMPEMMDGRVKTLHPAIHAGILARRGHPADRDDLSRHGIQPIDIVVVNLYPFQQAAARPETQVAELVEEIDIGGPSLLRAAAKNFAHVLVLVDPADYAEAVSALAGPSDARGALHLRMARKAFAHTSRYDGVVAAALDAVDAQGDGAWVRVPPTDLAPPLLSVRAERIRALRYGENPHQEAAWYAGPQPVGFSGARLVQGKAPSYTNLLDLDAAARLVLEFEEPAAVVVKHTNPCGMAVATTPAAAYGHARDADPMSAFGGIVGVNRTIDAELARALVSTFIEAIVAPGVDADAAAILSTKPAVRLLTADFAAVALRGDQEIRSILGGWLVQRRDAVDEARAPWEGATRDPDIRVVTKRAPTADEWRALRFAWRVCAHVKSNAVIFTRTDRTVGIGAGQMSRVDAVRVATMKATSSLEGSVAASDAFFPFRDGLDALASAGATAVVQPGGSVRDPEVIAAADEHGLAMVFTGRRHFRH